MAAGTPMPFVRAQWFDNSGDPAAGYLLFTYEAGTTTKLASYSDAALTIPNTNPIILDSAGRATVFLSATSYKFVLAPPTDTDPPTTPLWTSDDVAAIPSFSVDLDLAGTAGENLVAGEAVYLSEGDGGRTAGRWYKTSASNAYSSSTAKALGMVPQNIASGVSGTIRIIGRMTGLSGLTTGSVYYLDTVAGTITLTPPADARALGIADSTTSLLMSEWLPIGVATTTQPGTVSIGTQSFAGAKTWTGTSEFTGGIIAVGTTTMQPPGTLSAQVDDVATTDTSETDGHTYTLPAGLLAADGDRVVIRGTGTFSNNANTKTIKFHVASTALTLASNAASASTDYNYEVTIIRRGASLTLITGLISYSNTIAAVPSRTTDASALSGTVVIKETLQMATAGTVTAERFTVDFFPAP